MITLCCAGCKVAEHSFFIPSAGTDWDFVDVLENASGEGGLNCGTRSLRSVKEAPPDMAFPFFLLLSGWPQAIQQAY